METASLLEKALLWKGWNISRKPESNIVFVNVWALNGKIMFKENDGNAKVYYS